MMPSSTDSLMDLVHEVVDVTGSLALTDSSSSDRCAMHFEAALSRFKANHGVAGLSVETPVENSDTACP